MELGPIFSAMRRNKVGALVIVIQTAITLAILCNSLFIIQQRLRLSDRPSGVQEQDVFTIANQWIGSPSDLTSRLQTDVASLRALPEVADAFVSNSFPLSQGGWGEGVGLQPNEAHWLSNSALYFMDEHGINTFGVKLVAGRNFEASEIVDRRALDTKSVNTVIITKALASLLYPNGDALGKPIYYSSQKTAVTVVGIVERLQQPWVSVENTRAEYATIQPYRYIEDYSHYIVRAKPGQVDAAIKSAQKVLLGNSRARVIESTRTMKETRALAYQDDRALAAILGTVSIVLLIVTAFGIVGVTSFWVSQRRRQIGIRRAMGATRTAILRYFQTENFMIASAGSVLGVVLALALNFALMGKFEMGRLNLGFAIMAAAIVLVLGQIAVLWPALRAASISPVVAIRNA